MSTESGGFCMEPVRSKKRRLYGTCLEHGKNPCSKKTAFMFQLIFSKPLNISRLGKTRGWNLGAESGRAQNCSKTGLRYLLQKQGVRANSGGTYAGTSGAPPLRGGRENVKTKSYTSFYTPQIERNVMTQKRCGCCKFFENLNRPEGECRHSPPVASDSWPLPSRWPVVTVSSWCGKFSRCCGDPARVEQASE